MCYICRNHNVILSSFVTYHRDCNKSNTTGFTCGAGTVFPEHLSSPPHISEAFVSLSLVSVESFVDRCLSFCRAFFSHCVVCPTSINRIGDVKVGVLASGAIDRGF